MINLPTAGNTARQAITFCVNWSYAKLPTAGELLDNSVELTTYQMETPLTWQTAESGEIVRQQREKEE